MSNRLQAVRGMRDVLPDESSRWQYIERKIIDILHRYAYQEIRLPIIEKTELFIHSIGDHTDIVSKEMYSFEDRNGNSLTLRPEGTAGCVRAGIQHSLFRSQKQKFWYMGPMFRHERPQQGRQRQFYQIGVEAFGFIGPDIDAEMILLSARLWRELGLKNVRLQLNSLGNATARADYHEALTKYFSQHKQALDKDSLYRLNKNPLRILDSKSAIMQPLINAAPEIQNYLDKNSRIHFEKLQYLLSEAGIEYEINTRLVRGLDYYTDTVFEWVTDQLGAQNAICAGGRYDRLVEKFSGKSLPAFGLAMGMERLIALVDLEGYRIEQQPLHVFLVLSDEPLVVNAAMKLAEHLRDQLPWLRLMVGYGGGSLKGQFKQADRSGAVLALVMGMKEVQDQTVGLKFLKERLEQQQVSWGDLSEKLAQSI